MSEKYTAEMWYASELVFCEWWRDHPDNGGFCDTPEFADLTQDRINFLRDILSQEAIDAARQRHEVNMVESVH